jgi:hypothetical protein
MIKGFQNAPTITEFKRGMRIMHKGECRIVQWIDKNGDAHCSCDPDEGISAIVSLLQIDQYALDLASIWEGRPYRGKVNPDARCTVRMTDGKLVAYEFTDGVFGCLPLDAFRKHWEPVPPEEQPTPEPEPQTPPTAEDYLRGHKASGIKVGDRRKVIRAASTDEGGWLMDWPEEMNDMVGNTYSVEADCEEEGFKMDNGALVPYFVLGKVAEQPAPQPWQPEVGKEC